MAPSVSHRLGLANPSLSLLLVATCLSPALAVSLSLACSLSPPLLLPRLLSSTWTKVLSKRSSLASPEASRRGEKGLKDFIEWNPSPSEAKARAGGEAESIAVLPARAKPKPPELPLFLPGMIVMVKNPKNPFHMYSGSVQRVTDGKAGVLFEGGNWDKLLTFDLVKRREKGPPMVNPKSAVLESIVEEA